MRVEQTAGGTVLYVPDFRGNFYFNTLGNIAQHPRAGLLLIDFVAGDALSLTGKAEVLWDGPQVSAFKGAERMLRWQADAGFWLEKALPLRWSPPEPARQLAATGP